MIFLGVDYGRVKIGLALGNELAVWPVAVWKNKEGFFRRIKVFCLENQVEKIIVGLPEGELEREIRNFGQQLGQLTGLAVIYEAETLTTQEAIAKMIQVGKKKKFRQKKEDAFAAAMILENYLNRL
ncbi:MAG: Holliday junction resolvase RuvX [Candidatus Pacebacteria bacterium]|nr:Holliday junction resolvase RuvX [Candidatus Paceibacterota bacterium]